MHPLTQLYGSDPRVQEFVNGLGAKNYLEFQRSKTSFDSIFYAQVAQDIQGKSAFIFSTDDEANDFYHDIKLILPELTVFLIESTTSVKNKTIYRPSYKIQQLSQQLEAIISAKNAIIVCNPLALIEKVLLPQKSQQSIIEKGSKIHLKTLVDYLDSNGYERETFVYEYGQYAIRGNIIDIYSYSHRLPIRLDLFDIEVEDIRCFDIESQLSIDSIEKLYISPKPSQNPTLFDEISVLDIALSNSVFIQNRDLLVKQLKAELEHLSELEVDETLEADNIFISKKRIDEIRKTELVERKSNMNIEPAPMIHKNFNKLYQSVSEYNEKRYQVYLMSDEEVQKERYKQIFIDLGGEQSFYHIQGELSKGYIDHDKKIVVLTTHEIFSKKIYHNQTTQVNISAQAQLLKAFKEMKPGDWVTHFDHGVGRFSGLEKIEVGGHFQEAVRLIYSNNDILYVHINSLHKISKYIGKEGVEPRLHKLGSDTWENTKRKTKSRIKDIAEELIKLYAKRKTTKGFAFSPDTYMQYELETSFEYEDTPDQAKASQDVKQDMEREIPMDRLVCGDVGFGKTEVAIRAAFKAVSDSKQVAVLVPTTILAFQHYLTFKKRLEGFPCNIEFINRFKSTKEKNDIVKRLEEGKVDILIGTHGIVSPKIKFKDLGLLVVDEEQKFGVAVKEKLKSIKLNVDTLTMTATPIPRTLQFSLLGARDYSLIQTPPPSRQTIYTEVATFDPDYLKEIIDNEIKRGGQVFFVHNKVKDLYSLKDMLMRILPDANIAIAHGQLEGDQIEKILLEFIDKKHDVLLSTNIVESGIDIPNANTMIINNSHQFGLSDLHQLRGRVGRSNKKAYCYLLAPPYSTLTNEAKQRLQAMEQNAELGSGFQIAMRDLDLRGAGNMLGGEQSGFISDIGYDTFMKILDEAILELKDGEYKELYQDETKQNELKYARECQIETDGDMYIPDNYIPNSQDRMKVYTDVNQLKNEVELNNYLKNIQDIYGKLPKQIKEISDSIKLKWVATQLGVERIIIKNGKLKCFLIANQESSFYQSETFSKILLYIQNNTNGVSFKQTPQKLILEFNQISKTIEAIQKLNDIKNA